MLSKPILLRRPWFCTYVTTLLHVALREVHYVFAIVTDVQQVYIHSADILELFLRQLVTLVSYTLGRYHRGVLHRRENVLRRESELNASSTAPPLI